MVAKWYVALTSKLVSFIVTGILLPVVRSAHHHTNMHFNQFSTSTAHSGCTSYSHQQRLLGSQRTHGTVSCWVALIETAYVLSQAKWVGRDEKEKNLTKHHIKVWQQKRFFHVAQSSAFPHMHALWTSYAWFTFFCTYCYEYSKVKSFLITVTENCFLCKWVTRRIVCCLYCFFGVVNDQCRK